MAGHEPQGKQSAVLDSFLGLITNIRYESVPEGAAALCWDVDFLVGEVHTRPGLVSQYSLCFEEV